MIYFTLYDHILACLIFAVIGAILGVLYKSINTIFAFLVRTLFIGIKAFKEQSPYIKQEQSGIINTVKHRNIIDFIFFLFSAIIYLIFNYVALDGEIRLHTTLICVLSFCIFKKLFSISIDYALKAALTKLYAILFFVVYWIFLPIKALSLSVKKITDPLINSIKYKIYNRKFIIFRKEESKKIKNLLLKI